MHRVRTHGQQAEGPPSEAQEPGADLHAAGTQRPQAHQLCQRSVGQGPLQCEPLLQNTNTSWLSLPDPQKCNWPSNTPGPPPMPLAWDGGTQLSR